MLIKKTKKVFKEVEEVTERYYQCDKCKNKIEKKSGYDCYEFVFEITTGESYGTDGGSGDRWELDLCESCSLELVGKLKGDEYDVRHNEWDF